MEKGKTWAIYLTVVILFIVGETSFALAASSDYPTRSIDVVQPYGPGGGTDMASRLFKEKVEKILGKPLVPSYKPGSAGVVANLYVKGAKPDGYTLLMTSSSTLTIPQLTNPKVDYSLDDFTPILNYTYNPQIFCVKYDAPYKTMQDFIQTAKTKKMTYSTPGVFSIAHIGMEALGRAAGFRATHVPYSAGAGAAMTAVIGGHVEMVVCGPAGMLGPGRLRVLAVGSETRWEIQPDVPTLKELGYPVLVDIYFSLWGPKGIPNEAVNKLYSAHRKALEEDREEIIKRAQAADQMIRLLGPDETGKTYREVYESYKKEIGRMGPPQK